METSQSSLWAKSKLLIKAGIIAFIILLLQIPTFFVQGLVRERQERQQEAIREVSSKWAGRQTLTGPVLVVPYVVAGKGERAPEERHYVTFLPDTLQVDALATPEERYRGIYKVLLFSSSASIAGSFGGLQPGRLGLNAEALRWNEAFVKLHVTDLRGLSEEPVMNWNGQTLTFAISPGTDSREGEVLTAPLPLSGPADAANARFRLSLRLNGSEELLFTPVGKSTTVNLRSSWPHPSFSGSLLPQRKQVGDSGFSATWRSLGIKRSFPQQWKDAEYVVAGPQATAVIPQSAFGVELYVPVNGYQRTMRSVKYAFLCLLLTFTAFFLMETQYGSGMVHPLQYCLIGLALVLFYTLLLSFSEYIGFNAAYALASVATIGLVAWFVRSLLRSARLSLVLSLVLVMLYLYVFTILQLQDYSLLFGSIGLFLTLAVVMRYSRRLQW
jgi:inner membrane protein